MIDHKSIAFHAIARCVLTAFSVDEILMLRYVNRSSNFRRFPLKVDMAPYS